MVVDVGPVGLLGASLAAYWCTGCRGDEVFSLSFCMTGLAGPSSAFSDCSPVGFGSWFAGAPAGLSTWGTCTGSAGARTEDEGACAGLMES